MAPSSTLIKADYTMKRCKFLMYICNGHLCCYLERKQCIHIKNFSLRIQNVILSSAVIFETKDVYFQKEFHLGMETEQWFDVTDYERIKEDKEHKYYIGPLMLFVCKFHYLTGKLMFKVFPSVRWIVCTGFTTDGTSQSIKIITGVINPMGISSVHTFMFSLYYHNIPDKRTIFNFNGRSVLKLEHF